MDTIVMNHLSKTYPNGKKATASSYHAFKLQGLELPQINDYSIVTNFNKEPKCIIQTKEILILPFK